MSTTWKGSVRALFPGHSTPSPQGHRDILRRSANLFDDVVACVMFNPNKTGRFIATAVTSW
ncbi:MAG TPA: hypothetical protein VFW65_10140 [Pseudonocardiaceae bacterium]|nr:hypothetical protein [Pseudonocardiaceae bacterium]